MDNEENILKFNPLHPKQHGFRKGKSTCSALTSFVGQIEHAIINRDDKQVEHCIVVKTTCKRDT